MRMDIMVSISTRSDMNAENRAKIYIHFKLIKESSFYLVYPSGHAFLKQFAALFCLKG